MKASLTSSGIWPTANFSLEAGPSFCSTSPSAERIVTVPGRLKALMPRASGSRPSICCSTAELPNAAVVPAAAATTPAKIKRRRRGIFTGRRGAAPLFWDWLFSSGVRANGRVPEKNRVEKT